MSNYMKELIKNALILCGITVIAGLLLGGVYELTKEPREKQQEQSQQDAYREVVSEADSFQELDADMDAIAELLGEYGITDKSVVIDKCVNALDENKNIIGCIVSVTSKEGYGGNISFSVGFDIEANITGVSILSISETAGLGMNAKDESFLNQYKSTGEGLFVVNKTDSQEGVKIDAISGATITTKAMTKGVNASKIVAEKFLIREEANTEIDTADTDAEAGTTEGITEGGESDE